MDTDTDLFGGDEPTAPLFSAVDVTLIEPDPSNAVPNAPIIPTGPLLGTIIPSAPVAATVVPTTPLPTVLSTTPLLSVMSSLTVAAVITTPNFPTITPSGTATIVSSYIPPLVSTDGAAAAAGTALSLFNDPNPATPPFTVDWDWAHAYFLIHQLSPASSRYIYLFWIAVSIVTLAATLLHWTGSRGGVFAAWFNKFGLRRRTWRKKQSLEKAKREGKPFRQPDSFPPNAQLIILTLLFIASVLVSFIGPDHISPYTGVWDFTNNLTRREYGENYSYTIPQYTIVKSWWTSGGRVGLTAFALFPLCILFALKQAPFAIFSLSFLTQIHFDKLARFHIWTGRLIWFVTTVHVVLWSVQLGLDKRGAGTQNSVWAYGFLHTPFICACIGYICLTAIVVLSLSSVRARSYEVFYIGHVILVPLTLIFAGLHFPSMGWWCWGTLIFWMSERLYRLVRWSYINGYIFAPPVSRNLRVIHDRGFATMHSRMSGVSEFGVRRDGSSLEREGSMHTYRSSKRDSYGSTTSLVGGRGSPGPVSKRESFHYVDTAPPPGWAHVTLLPGKTIRLRLLTARPVEWAPGQHVLLRVPCVSKYTTHPFTIASVCDNATLTGHVVELIIRAQGGFTLKLWDTIVRLSSRRHYQREKGDRSRRGAYVKADVDGPFGSSIRARWGANSTFIIVAGGSGISFGCSLLEYVCLCISGRDGKELGSLPGGWGHGDFKTTRVRFVWMIREYSHIQWAAGIIRRCMDMVPSYTLQVDIYVSNTKSIQTSYAPKHTPRPSEVEDRPLPDRPKRMRSGSTSSVESNDALLPHDSTRDSMMTDGESGYSKEPTDFGLGHEEHDLDMTNFGGEHDGKSPQEDILNMKVKEEGKLRRAMTRAKAMDAAVKSDMEKFGDGRKARALPSGAHNPSGHMKRLSHTRSPFTSADIYTPKGKRAEGLSGPMGDGVFNPQVTESPVNQEKVGTDGKAEPKPKPAMVMEDFLDLELDAEELEDMSIVSEMTHPGKPKLDEIIFEEVEKSKGAVGVACCGPISLNAVVRKIVAANISPERILAGDMRGSINLATEEFEW